MRFALALVALSACASMCACPPPPLPPEPGYVVYPPEDSAPASSRDPLCRLACENMAKMGCPESATLDGGLDCPTVCEHALDAGVPLPLAKLAAAGTPDQLRELGVRCIGR